jgi:hypothetical protein
MRRWVLVLMTGAVAGLSGGNSMATEEPSFKVTLKKGQIEVRDYPALIAAEVRVSGDRGEAVSAGFKLLAGYIFGGNERRQSIAMTAPVMQTSNGSAGSGASGSEKIAMTAPVMQSGEDGAWTIRFMMPKEYTLATLPVPKDTRVQLVSLPPARFGVIRFSGLAREPDIESNTAELKAFIASNHFSIAGPASLARYDPPWTPWFMRRNEVLIALNVDAAQ